MAKTPAGTEQNPRPGPGWFTKVECAAWFDVSATQIDRHYRRLIAETAVKKGGKGARNWFHGRSMIDAHVKHILTREIPHADADPLLQGDSPALERYRLAKAKITELELDAKRGDAVPKHEVHEVMARCATILRETGARLGRECGREAQDMLDEALGDFEKEVEAAFAAGKGE